MNNTLLEDIKLVTFAAEAIASESLGTLPSLKEICGFRREYFKSAGPVFHWRQSLLGKMSMAVSKYLRSPRLIISGAVSAWNEISLSTDPIEREDKRLALIQETFDAILENREEGTRAVSPPLADPETDKLGVDLAEQLLITGNRG
jgi:hypothetical protein